MKRALLAIPFLLLLLFAARREAASQSNLVKQIAPGVYYREAEPDKKIIATTGWVVFRDYVLVIDANFPWGAKAVMPEIRATTNKPVKYVFNTHYHGDHMFGDSVWVDAGATIVCSAECTAESLARNTANWKGDELKPYRLEHPQISFQDKLVFDDGTQRVELTRVGPGHTRGDAVAYLPKQKILFTGDLCVNRPGNYVGDPDADHDGWVRALDGLAQWDVAQVVPGHGSVGNRETLRGQSAYMAAMVAAVRAGKSVDEVAKTDLSRFKPWGENATSNANSLKQIWAKMK